MSTQWWSKIDLISEQIKYDTEMRNKKIDGLRRHIDGGREMAKFPPNLKNDAKNAHIDKTKSPTDRQWIF